MASTVFVNGQTLTDAGWFNDVNTVAYKGFPGYLSIAVSLTYADTGLLGQFASNTSGYNQFVIQNTNSGTGSSTSFLASNDQGTANTNYVEHGINSSTFSGAGAFNQPGYGYIASASTDLAIGTYGNNSIHFVTNSGTVDAFSIISAGTLGAPKVPNYTTTQKNTLGNITGAVVYDTTLGQYQGNNGAAWSALGASFNGGTVTNPITAPGFTANTQSGVTYSDGNIVTHLASSPTTGSWTIGDVVLESTSTTRLSGWKRITTGSGNVLNTDWVYCSNLISGTAQATTSGTSVTFTGIPSWAKRVTVNWKGVGTSGTSYKQLQIGNGSIVTTGYLSCFSYVAAGVTGAVNATTGFPLSSATAADRIHGTIVLTLENSATNTWIASGTLAASNSALTFNVAGSIALSGVLDRVSLTTVNGTDTFAAGELNITWE